MSKYFTSIGRPKYGNKNILCYMYLSHIVDAHKISHHIAKLNNSYSNDIYDIFYNSSDAAFEKECISINCESLFETLQDTYNNPGNSGNEITKVMDEIVNEMNNLFIKKHNRNVYDHYLELPYSTNVFFDYNVEKSILDDIVRMAEYDAAHSLGIDVSDYYFDFNAKYLLKNHKEMCFIFNYIENKQLIDKLKINMTNSSYSLNDFYHIFRKEFYKYFSDYA